MSDPASSAPVQLADARPVDTSERVTLLDALRGFALCGVFVSNSVSWFSGRVMMPREQAQALAAPLLETVTTGLYQFFVNQKFVTLFSFLFGLGFSIQLARAEARGSSIVRLYARRLLVLLAIGLTHQYAIWCGDILHTYAMVGFALLLFRNRSNTTVLIWAVALMAVVPLLIPALERFVPIWLHGAEAAGEAAKAARALETASRTRLLEALSSDSFWTALVGTARFNNESYLRINRLVWMSLILGRFLFGLLAGRLLLLQDLDGNRRLHHRLLFWGLFLGVIGNGLGLLVWRLRAMGMGDFVSRDWMMVLTVVQELGCLTLAAAYVALFALLSRRGWVQRVFNVLMPVGRMALSNYLLQSVVSVWVYNGWGLGLIGKLPPSRSILLALGIFAVQIVLSHLWLARFRFGPAEWLWRSLTYGRAQPMRLPAGHGEVGAAPS
ncbi:DUF418 domain-containing protein [Myxococcus sp. CA051A]|uniref:DUF418 domain-containing protein n=1 Tax=Myxococcus llanfairpwllgwyngyllgogerychwyrndrobwllllantysiliogogogochensis TaxID=2590453 RepID=A0A540WQQ1_9BACT|nr:MULTISPECIES: DUF418 domain-containing protein [Myxococcus]NTX59495.1 DUF418 domain-containing protein [Myxococcus sp. CA051A]TQF11345.1 DUF418 domain-containing protein [Myxococcus llanfairpwllgwyngyllgogerychwyrndrobwllllantysiliogogogochensis]